MRQRDCLKKLLVQRFGAVLAVLAVQLAAVVKLIVDEDLGRRCMCMCMCICNRTNTRTTRTSATAVLLERAYALHARLGATSDDFPDTVQRAQVGGGLSVVVAPVVGK